MLQIESVTFEGWQPGFTCLQLLRTQAAEHWLIKASSLPNWILLQDHLYLIPDQGPWGPLLFSVTSCGDVITYVVRLCQGSGSTILPLKHWRKDRAEQSVLKLMCTAVRLKAWLKTKRCSASRSECGHVYSHATMMGINSRSWSNETKHDLSWKECGLLDTHMSRCLMLVSLFVSVFGEACSPDPCSLSGERGAPPAACQVRPESQKHLFPKARTVGWWLDNGWMQQRCEEPHGWMLAHSCYPHWEQWCS